MAFFYQSPTRNLPAGYTFCGATLNDIPVIIYLLNQRKMCTPNACNFSYEEMRKEWQASKINPALDARLIFDQREKLAGYIEVWTADPLAAQPWLWGCVHPDYEGRGIGTALLRWAEERVRLAMEILPNNLRVAPHFSILKTLDKAPALCQALGWQLFNQERNSAAPVKRWLIAMRLAQHTGMLTRSAYDVYEKEIRSGAA